MKTSTDFLVIGAGAVGLTSAIALRREGYSVTVVERGQVGLEASWAGGGILSPLCSWDYPKPVTQLAHRSMTMFPDAVDAVHQATGIDPEYEHSGMLVLPPFSNERAQQWCAENNFTVQSVKLIDHFPLEKQSGLLLPEVAQLRNPRWLHALRRYAESLGCVLHEQCEVGNFVRQGNRIVALQTTQGELNADSYIVTAGAWSQVLLGEHALRMDIRPIRGQILLFKLEKPAFQHILLKEDLYVIPRRDGHILVGSTLEDVGFDKSTTTEARTNLQQRVGEVVPELALRQPVKHWAGLRPGSPSNIPTIGRHADITNLYANSGHFRYGVTMSLASAELLVNEVTGRPQPFTTEAYCWR